MIKSRPNSLRSILQHIVNLLIPCARKTDTSFTRLPLYAMACPPCSAFANEYPSPAQARAGPLVIARLTISGIVSSAASLASSAAWRSACRFFMLSVVYVVSCAERRRRLKEGDYG
jgi:hypothetical protein